MHGHGGAGGCGISGLQRGVDGAVLVQQRVAGAALAEHDGAVVEDAFAQQLIHRPHHVQHDDVMAGLDDGQMEIRVQLRFFGGIAFLMRGLHPGEERVDHPEVGVGAMGRGAFGGEPFHVAAEAQVIEHRLVMIREKLDQRVGKGRAQHLGHEDPRPRPGFQQAARLQFGHCLAQRRAGHAQPFRQVAFGGQPFAGAQDAAQDQFLDLAHHRGGEFFGHDGSEGHLEDPDGNWSDHMTTPPARQAVRAHQRRSASSSSSLAATQASPAVPLSFFQNGARVLR